ncbi:MAG: RNA polymerase subunit sigma [Actinomycetota bacterium]|nr:RNA polymerase subunit sigma [Actinomycetota bacterium]
MAGSHYAHMQPAETPTDAPVALLARIAQGDREAFGRFYDAFAGLALGLIRRIVRDPAASEEEVFWQIWQEAARYDPRRGSPEAWVVMRSKTRAIDRLRAIRRREKTFVAPADESVARSSEAPAENPGVAAETRGLVRSALDALPEPQRRVVELAFFEGPDAVGDRQPPGRAARHGQDAGAAGARAAADPDDGKGASGAMIEEIEP